MQKRRACVVSFLVSCFFTLSVVTQAQGARTPFEISHRKSFRRQLSAVFDVEICHWIQDASCQLNPEYARHMLSNSQSTPISEEQEATLREAECLSMAHEAACISHEHLCEWVGQDTTTYQGSSLCQYKAKHVVSSHCSVSSLKPFVDAYMRCRRQGGGVCSREHDCESVQISGDNQGCGIRSRIALDKIIGTSASQTEVIAHLVESALEFSDLTLPLVPENEFSDKGRHLLQKSSQDGKILAVEDDGHGSGASATSRSTLVGTGEETESGLTVARTDENPSDDGSTENGGVSVSSQPSSEAVSPEPIAPQSISAPDTEEKPTSVAGSLSFDVSEHRGSPAVSSSQHTSSQPQQTIESIARMPLALKGDFTHLLQIDTTIPVQLSDVLSVVKRLTKVIEMDAIDVTGKKEIFLAAERLESMRFRMDSRLGEAVEKENWNSTDSIWWSLQETAQSLDSALEGERDFKLTISIASITLLRTIDESVNLWKPEKGRKDYQRYTNLHHRLRTVQERTPRISAEADFERFIIIDNLDKLVTVVVDTYNRSLHQTYPKVLNAAFAEAYNQSWIRLLIDRNEKWCAMREFIAEESVFGVRVVELVQGMYRVHSPRSTISALPLLTNLNWIVDDLVGAVMATYSDAYTIENLPKELQSRGLDIWQRGPNITVSLLHAARKQTIDILENSQYTSIEGFQPASDKITSLLEAVIGLIDAKSLYSKGSKGIPEDTAILLMMENALKVISCWTDFALANNLENKAEKDPFGNPSIIDFSLSLVGCLALGPRLRSSGGHIQSCQNIDRSRCEITGLRRWNSTLGSMSLSSNHSICAPENPAKALRDLFSDELAADQLDLLIKNVTDLYFITAYCPYLQPEKCRVDARCSVEIIEDRLRCRPSSNFINYIVEANRLAGLAGTRPSCSSYLELPVCGNLKSENSCSQTRGCLWTHRHFQSNLNTSGGSCITDWVAQMRLVESRSLPPNTSECQEQSTHKNCQRHNANGHNDSAHSTKLPKHKAVTPTWLAYCFSVLAAIGVASLLYLVWRTFSRKSDEQQRTRRAKKSKRKKKGEQVPMPRGPPPPMFSYPLEIDSNKRDDFAFVMEAFGNENSFTAVSRSRMISHGRIERYTSSTTGDFPEIQPDDEAEEEIFSSESEESGEAGWTSSEAWSDDDDDESATELPS